jgi:CRP-like cAMP-binding protein
MCPRNTSIYHAGDIGWDIYFIESGLVRMELPKDLSILDEEGRANMRKTKEKADAVGLIYRPGNHFGESCLGSISGVRRESTIATTVVELYLLSKESLDNIFRYTPQEERECLKRKLLTRNGNVWHSFDETETESPMETQSFRRSKVAKSPTSFLSWTRPQRFTLTQSASTSFSSSSSSSSLRSTRRRQYRNSRLRSFSAQASTQVLRLSTTNVETSSNRESLAVLHEHTTSTPDADAENLETLDAIEAARMIQNGHVIIDALESESESTCSSYQNSVIASTCSDTG